MDTRTGFLVPQEEVDKLPEEEKKHFKPVDQSVMRNRKRMRILLNDKCGCGSGKKFKNCCYNPQVVTDER